MTLVMIIPNWENGGLLRLTPGEAGWWNGVEFTEERVIECDYVLVINHPLEDVTVRCSSDSVWALMMEPPNEYYRPLHWGDRSYARIYTSDESLTGCRYIHAHPCVPWQVDRNYDALSNCARPEKERVLSWVTSNKATFRGHKRRLAFLERIQPQLSFDLYGRGFAPISDKWDGVAPYQYSLAIENFTSPYYWTEKIADCFLAWTMPFYYGCTRIDEYFPKEAFVQIDIEDPDCVDVIRETIARDQWRRSLDAIEHARNLVLNKYQLFPFITEQIQRHQGARDRDPGTKELMTVPRKPRLPVRAEAQLFARRVRSRLRRRFSPL